MSHPTPRPERDTQFAGFAKLLYDEIGMLNENQFSAQHYSNYQPFDEAAKKLIAQRAYDFLVSSHYHTSMLATWKESRERVALVPDLAEWPPE